MSFCIRKHKFKKPVYVQNKTKEKILDKEGKPVLDKDGNFTYKVNSVSSESAKIKSRMSDRLGYDVSSTLRIRSSNLNSCDYF